MGLALASSGDFATHAHLHPPALDGTASGDNRLPAVSMGAAFRTWCRVAALSFGGPAGQIAVMHRILVDEKKWIGEERFLHALNYCQLLPGPEAQQLATYIGWLMHGTRGGLMAGTLFVLPGFVCILALSMFYTRFQQTDLLAAIFYGLKPAVVAIVAEAVVRIGRRVLKNATQVTLAVVAFIAIFLFDFPFFQLIIIAGAVGYIGGRLGLAHFPSRAEKTATTNSAHQSNPAGSRGLPVQRVGPLWRRSLLVTAICIPLWLGPVLAFRLLLGPDSVFVQEGVFFSQAAVVTFGGAYSVLAYVAQRAVDDFGWLQPGEMQDGLGMAETTPGPLIMVVQFVGFLGAYRNPGPFTPLAAGVIGSVLTTWVTFVPCFYWIFLGAPYVEQLRGNRSLANALAAISAAVVGAVLSLAMWFSLHTLFGSISVVHVAGLRLQVPIWTSLDPGAVLIAAIAMLLIFYWKRGLVVTLGASVALGIAIRWLQSGFAGS